MENSFNRLINWLDTAEETINNPKEKLTEITHTETQREKKEKLKKPTPSYVRTVGYNIRV